MYALQFISIFGSIALLLVVFNLIRADRLKIRYALLWIATAVLMLVFSFWRKLIDIIALKLGIFYPPSVLFLAVFLFLLVIVLHFSVVISAFAVQNRKLAQKVALLSQKVKKLEDRQGA